MDSYDIQNIAERAASEAAADVRREMEYKIEDLQRDLDRLRNELDDERRMRKEALASLSDALASVGG